MFVQHENCSTVSILIACVRGLKHKISNVSSTFNSSILKALEASLVKSLPYEDNELFLVASVLHPRFKLKWAQGSDEHFTRAASYYMSSV